MNIRQPVRAGSFYEAAATSCRRHALKLVESAQLPADLPSRLFGGLVPHAGWMYSGTLAATTFKALSQSATNPTLVLLGADHCGTVRKGEVFNSGVWQSPLGEVSVDEDLAGKLLAASPLLRANPSAHAFEHSLEVQIPLIQILWPEAKIVPIGVPATAQAVEIGRVIGQVLAKLDAPALVVGSTDLTHHGGHFPAPGGHGQAGVDWTVRNDRNMIDLVTAMKAEDIVPQAAQHGSACGPGAIAAAVAACREMGAQRGLCLQYTNSYDIVHRIYPDEPDDTTVGYASIVFA